MSFRPLPYLLLAAVIGLPFTSFTQEHYPRVSLRFAAEGGIMAIGDINTTLKSFDNNERFAYIRENNPSYASLEGHVRPLVDTFGNWESELRIDFSKKIGVGVAVGGSMTRQNEGTVSLIKHYAEDWPSSYFYSPIVHISAPIRLSVYYYVFRGRRLTGYISAGFGYYTGKLNERYNYENINGVSGDREWTRNYWETHRKGTPGFHIGQGVEIHFWQRLALIGEIQWRYAKLTNLRATNWYETGYPLSEVTEGYLWYLTGEDLLAWGVRYGQLMVSEISPSELYSFFFWRDVRKASLDLSSMSIKIGIRLGLF